MTIHTKLPQASREFDGKSDRLALLFALHKQVPEDPMARARGSRAPAHLSPQVETMLRDAATRSLCERPETTQPKLGQFFKSLSLRKPVATTNFSDESDRLAGGLTLATLSNRRLSKA